MTQQLYETTISKEINLAAEGPKYTQTILKYSFTLVITDYSKRSFTFQFQLRP